MNQFIADLIIGTGVALIFAVALLWAISKWLDWYEARARRPPLPECFGQYPQDSAQAAENECWSCADSWLCKQKRRIYEGNAIDPRDARMDGLMNGIGFQTNVGSCYLLEIGAPEAPEPHPEGSTHAMRFPYSSHEEIATALAKCQLHALTNCPSDLKFKIRRLEHYGKTGAWEWYSVPKTDSGPSLDLREHAEEAPDIGGSFAGAGQGGNHDDE